MIPTASSRFVSFTNRDSDLLSKPPSTDYKPAVGDDCCAGGGGGGGDAGGGSSWFGGPNGFSGSPLGGRIIGPAGFSRASKLSHRNLNVMSELRTGDGICHKELIDILNSKCHYRDFCFAVKTQLANW